MSGNGIDLAAVYQLLSEVARKVGDHDRRFDQIDRRFDQIHARFQEIDARLGEMTADIAGLRESVCRRRIERHLKLDPAI